MTSLARQALAPDMHEHQRQLVELSFDDRGQSTSENNHLRCGTVWFD